MAIIVQKIADGRPEVSRTEIKDHLKSIFDNHIIVRELSSMKIWDRLVPVTKHDLEQSENRILAAITQLENKMAATLDDLISDVTDESTVITSVETLLTGLSAQLAAAIAANDPAKIQQVKDAIDSNKARLAAAVAENTKTP